MAKGAGKAEKPENTEKSQAELREALELKLKSIKTSLQDGIKEYEKALRDDVFEDQEGEPEGSGDARKEAFQKKLTAFFDRAEKIKKQLDSGEPLTQASPEISTTYTHPDGHKETITLDFEDKLQKFISFYQKNSIDLPTDFEDTVRDIFINNQDEIEKAVMENGFDELLILPGNVPLVELKDKMTMEKGYYEGSNFTEGGSFAGAVSQNADKPRLVLVHKTQNLKDRPELKKTLNIKGKDVKMEEAMSLEDYIVFQKKYFEETGKHLDEDGATWLATKSGVRLVDSFWNPGGRKLFVDADGLGSQNGSLGVRPSRCFF
jgi:cytochrome b involved in lipid metabolism